MKECTSLLQEQTERVAVDAGDVDKDDVDEENAAIPVR